MFSAADLEWWPVALTCDRMSFAGDVGEDAVCGEMARLIMGAGTFWNRCKPKEVQRKSSSDIAPDVAWWAVEQAELSILDAIDARAWADERAAASGRGHRGSCPNVTFGPAQGTQPDASMPESVG